MSQPVAKSQPMPAQVQSTKQPPRFSIISSAFLCLGRRWQRKFLLDVLASLLPLLTLAENEVSGIIDKLNKGGASCREGLLHIMRLAQESSPTWQEHFDKLLIAVLDSIETEQAYFKI